MTACAGRVASDTRPSVSIRREIICKSLPLEMAVKFVFMANSTEMIKSPVCVVVTAGPEVLLRVTVPLAVFVASGAADKIPDTSQVVISTCVGEPTKLGVTTVAPATELSAYQISTEAEPVVGLAPAET